MLSTALGLGVSVVGDISHTAGNEGSQMQPTEEWRTGKVYAKETIVKYNNHYYKAMYNHSSSNPSSEPWSDWKLVDKDNSDIGSTRLVSNNMYVAQRSGNEYWFASYLMTVNYINGNQSDYETKKQSLSQTEVMKQYKKFATSDPFIEGGGADLVVSCLNQDPTL